MKNTKFKLGDKVVVIAGKDKGKVGEIMKMNFDQKKERVRAVVKGVHIITKHIKATPQRPGQKIQFEAAVDASNLMAVCPKTEKRTRIGYKMVKDGDKTKKQRYAKVSNEPLDKAKK